MTKTAGRKKLVTNPIQFLLYFCQEIYSWRNSYMYVWIYVYVCVCVCVYIYIYISSYILRNKLKHFFWISRDIWNFSQYFQISKISSLYSPISRGTLVGKHWPTFNINTFNFYFWGQIRYNLRVHHLQNVV